MTKGRRQPPPAAPPSEEVRAKPPFELRYTSDAAADIKALDGSVRNQLRKVLEKKLAVDPEGYGCRCAGLWRAIGSTSSATTASFTEFIRSTT